MENETQPNIPQVSPPPQASNPIPTSPIGSNQGQKCSTDKDRPNNTFCDYSMPGGMGPNGQCQTFEIVGGDIVIDQKRCVNQNDQTLGIQINTCCSCPIKIRKSLIGTNGWVVYEKGKDYSSLRPVNNCKDAVCGPCHPLE